MYWSIIRAAFWALKTFASHLSNQHILLLIVNTTAVSYINKGWHNLQDTIRPLHKDVATVHGEKPHHSCRAHSRDSQ